jgi:predicted peroxiredoxin
MTKQEVHVVLVSNSASRSYPAFLLAVTAAQAGNKAVMYLTSEALSIVKKGNVAEQMPEMPTLEQVMENALKLGVEIYACGPNIAFLTANGVTMETVKPGINLDEAPTFLQKALAVAKNGGIVTYI